MNAISLEPFPQSPSNLKVVFIYLRGAIYFGLSAKNQIAAIKLIKCM